MGDPLDLRFVDMADPARHVVPAAALARALDALQRLALLLGRRRAGQMPNRRFTPSRAELARYRVVCDLSRPGSFEQPVRVEGSDLLSPQDAQAITDQIDAILSAADKGSVEAFDRAVDDETWRRFILPEIDRLAPAPETGVTLEVRRGGRVVCASARLRSFAAAASRRRDRQNERGAVVGTLKKIDFMGRQMTLRHEESGRELSCTYEEEIEGILIEHPREPILVFGLVTREVDGLPQSIDQADHIEAIDTGPIAIERVEVSGRVLIPHQPLKATVTFHEMDLVYEAVVEGLNIETFAETREALIAAVEEAVASAWEVYTAEPDASLTGPARLLKARLIDAFGGAADAS